MANRSNRRGRPTVVTAEHIEEVALRLWDDRGYEQVAVAEVAAAAGVTARTIFRRYPTKSDIIWGPIDKSFLGLRDHLAHAPSSGSLIDRARHGIRSALHADDSDNNRLRLRIIGRTPELQNNTSPPFLAWRQVLVEFVATALGQTTDDLAPLVIAHCVQAATMAGLIWAAEGSSSEPPWQAVDQALSQLPLILGDGT